MKLVGQKTESVYCRYAVQDGTMLREGADKLALLRDTQDGQVAASKVAQIKAKKA